MLFVVGMIIFSVPTLAAPKTAPSSSKIQISMVSQEPDPANPGDVIDVRFKIENLGGESTDDILLELVEAYPLSIYSGSAQKNIGSLQSRQEGEDAMIVLYRIKVDENAVEGEEEIDIRYTEDTGFSRSWVTFRDFPIRIRSRDLVVSAEVSSSPDPIPPGEEAVVTLTIKNDADSLIRDLKVKLDTSEEDVPFAPIKSTTQQSTYILDSGESAAMDFNIIATPESDGGVYKIPLSISYTDATGTEYVKEDVIGLRIGSSPDILATIDTVDSCKDLSLCTVTIKIVNRGLTNIKLLSTKLESNGVYEVISEPEVYIGNIDSDDYESVDYKIKVLSSEKSINLPLVLDYRDSTNKKYEETKQVIFHAENLKLTHGQQESSPLGYVIIVAIVAVGLVIYFWRRKKKKK